MNTYRVCYILVVQGKAERCVTPVLEVGPMTRVVDFLVKDPRVVANTIRVETIGEDY